MKRLHGITRLTALLLAALLTLGAAVGCHTQGEDSLTQPAETQTDTSQAGDPDGETTDNETDVPPEPTSLSLVEQGTGVSTITYTDGEHASAVAAYILRDAIAAATDVILPVTVYSADHTGTTVRLLSCNEDQVSDCGYDIKVNGGTLSLSAHSLAGFDNAIKRLMKDTSLTTGQMSVQLDYRATESIDSGANYTLEAEDFKPEYGNAPFYNDKHDAVAYVTNAMWHMFGAVDDGQGLVYRFGNEPTYFEWISEKIMWSGDSNYINDLKGKISSFPQTENGYMWSWSSYPYWQVSDTYCIHYDGTFRYIAAVYDVIAWESSTAFLYVTDTNTAGGEYTSLDASKGRTVLEKVEAAWNYILYSLHGEDGIIRLEEQSVFLNADGSERFDYVKATGKTCWDNTGLPNSAASNYWDNLCFGNLDAYESALFYESLQAMIGIYGMLGGEYLEQLPALHALAEKARAAYDETFWDDEKGRYIACVDTEGNRVDYGFTFLNFEALKYGLGDAGKATSVFDWIDGRRTIEGENRTGAEILSYATIMRKTSEYRKILKFDEGLALAPTVNTVAINNQDNAASGIVWWHGPEGINPWGSAAYGLHCENGGYIFYPVFYELMARTRYLGAASTTDRLKQIARVYEFNRLNSDAAAGGSAAWLEGLVGEFPESGLVPTVYLHGLMGIDAETDGFHVAPAFNDTWEYMGVTSTTYGGHAYGVEVNRDGSLTLTCSDGVADMTLCYTPGRFTTFTVTVCGKDGTEKAQTYKVDEAGLLRVPLNEQDVEKVLITPLYE